MKAVLLAAAALAMLTGHHATVHTIAGPLSIPLPVLALAAEAAVSIALGWLIARSAGLRFRIRARRFA